jgi:hypothetical protein
MLLAPIIDLPLSGSGKIARLVKPSGSAKF